MLNPSVKDRLLKLLAIMAFVIFLCAETLLLLLPPLIPSWGHEYGVALHRYYEHPSPEARATADLVRRIGQAKNAMFAVAEHIVFVGVDGLLVWRYRRWRGSRSAYHGHSKQSSF